MALIVIAADKGAPGVTTTALALAAVWPRPVLLAECDPSGGDLVYRFPAADGSALDPRRGMMTLAVTGRRGLQPGQLWEHTQKLSGGLDVLTGVINAEQGAGIGAFWGPLGDLFAALPGGDVIADCGRLGPDGPHYDLVVKADAVLLVTRPNPGDVIRLRDRAAAVAAAADTRGRRGVAPAVVVIADQRTLKAMAAEVAQTLAQGNVPATVAGGIADDAKGAELLRGEWGGRLDRTLLIRTARETAQRLAASLPSADMPGADMPGADMPSAGLPRADIPSAGLPSAGMPRADIPSAGLPGAGLLGGGDDAVPQRAARQSAPAQYPATVPHYPPNGVHYPPPPPPARQQYPPVPPYAPGRHQQPPPAPQSQYMPAGQPNGADGGYPRPVHPVHPAPVAGHEAGDDQWTTA